MRGFFYTLMSVTLFFVLITTRVQAIGISSMMEYADDRGEAIFTISNTDSYRQYINTSISELSVVNGELKKTPYTRDNIDIWALDVRPARTILEPGFKKNISVKYKPREQLDQDERDRVFQLSIVPTPYFSKGEKPLQVKMVFGFAPLLIVPAKQPKPLKYKIEYREDKVVVTNKGDTFFSLTLDGCSNNVSEKERDKCISTATVLSGRTLSIVLPKEMASRDEVKATMFSYGNKFKAQLTLSKQG